MNLKSSDIDGIGKKLDELIEVVNGGPGSGNYGHSGRLGKVGGSAPSSSIDVSKYSTYEDFEQDMFRGENRKENIEKLKEQGINSKDKMYLYFVNEKFKKQKITQMSLDEAKDTILENIPKSVAEGWFIKADSSYKKKIVQLIVENDNLRSASLSLAYETYKELINKNIGFNDFLNKELDLYRGDQEGKKFIEADSTSFISYTPFEDMAKKFGKVITKKTIKPKETLGVLRQVGEFEFLVPTFNQKKDVHKSKNSSVRMNDLLQKMDKILNGGPGSGNHNPGQGRGVGKPGNGMSTKSDKMLHDTVKQMADIFSTMNKREGYKYSSSEDLVLKQGKFFTPEKRPDGIELGPKKECFANASKLALERSDLTYVEGYAMVNDRLPLPIAHAWCVDKKGRVVDNTWENPGVAYFGVPFKTGYLAKKLSETGVYGILSGSVGSSDFLKDGVPSEGIANIKKQKNAIVMNGGEGSGNFGHKGRIGKVGGSSKDGSGSKVEFSEMLSKDAKEVLGEVNEYSEGAYFKEINSVLNDFSKLGVDVKKVKFETNVDKLPEKMRNQITDSTEGMISAKKNLEAVIYLDETKQSEYGLGGENKFLEGREPKDQSWATNNSPIGILRHELGHLAAYTVFMNSRGRKGNAGPILAGAVNLETHANLKKIFGEGYALNRLKLSRYGMKDSGEAVAESFANPNFSSDTKKIYDFYVNELRKKAQNNAVEDDGWLVLCLGFTTKDPLSNKVNQLIHKINEVTGKRGNPYHDEKGRFTFAPYQKYPLMEESVKKLATLYKNRRDIYDSGFYDAVYAERTKLHQEYSSEEEMKKSDKAIEDWIHGDTLEHKESVRFSDIDVALSKSLTREFHNQQTVYRGQYDSDTVDSKSITSWTPYEGQAVGFGKRAAQINDAEKVSLFKIKTTDKNVILSPEIIYSVDGIRDWLSQQEFIVQAPKTRAYHTEDVDSINPYKRYDTQNSYIWNGKDNGGGNPYHDEKGRFASGPSSSSDGGSKSSILEKGGIGEGYLGDTLDELDDDQLSKLAKNPIADLSDKRIREVASMRQKMYGTKEEFDLANQWLMSIVGNGADIMGKAKLLNFNPSKEIELSRRIIGDKEVTLFRNQEGDFDKKKYKESRWGDIPHSHSSSGNDYTIKGNKNNILIHPEVLYSADDTGDPFYRQEREYVVDNSKIKDVWRGIKL